MEGVRGACPELVEWIGVLNWGHDSACPSNQRPRFVPISALLVSIRDLQEARFVERFA